VATATQALRGLLDEDSLWSDTSPELILQNPSLAEPPGGNKRLDLTGQIGGPLIKDKLFFFLAAQRYEQVDNPTDAR